jgi:hypothetical protein
MRSSHAEEYYDKYDAAVRSLYSDKKVSVIEAITSIGHLITTLLGEDPYFQTFLEEFSQGDATDIRAPLLALRRYALEMDISQRSDSD